MRGPNARERKALTILRGQEWENKAQLQVGDGTVDSMLAEEWVERIADTPTGIVRYRITPAGRDALDLKPEQKAPPRPRLKTLAPSLKTAKPRIGIGRPRNT